MHPGVPLAAPAPAQAAGGTIPVIVNARAGSGGDVAWARDLESRFRAAGSPARVELVRDGAALVPALQREIAQDPRLIVAGGGDGTLNTVAAMLLGTPCALGMLPLGTFNHFARDLGIPTDLDGAVRTIVDGRDACVDVGEVNGHVFLNNSSLGIYPHFVLERERKRRIGWPKWPAAVPAAVAALRRFPQVEIELEIDGQCSRRRSPCVFVGNNEYELDAPALGERERLDAGVLTLHVTQRIGRLGLLRMAFRALLGRLERDRDLERLRVRAFRVHSHHARLRVSTDGEVLVLATPLDYRVRPRALRVRVPAV